jgi:hypothetical protein
MIASEEFRSQPAVAAPWNRTTLAGKREPCLAFLYVLANRFFTLYPLVVFGVLVGFRLVHGRLNRIHKVFDALRRRHRLKPGIPRIFDDRIVTGCFLAQNDVSLQEHQPVPIIVRVAGE